MNWGTLIVTLAGGLAIFLYGMNLMTSGLKVAAGGKLKSFLSGMTGNRWKALLAGMGITAIIQSSSVTTVLAVGFVSAGLLQFQNTLGIILGANIGTTITAQIIAFKITKASLVIVATGFLMSVSFKQKTYREVGNIILGLGLVFLGMNLMGEGTEPLKSYAPFLHIMQNLKHPFLGILFGAIFTALVQSSSATTGIVIMMASQNLVGIEASIALVIGANIGTCVTAILSALGKPRAAIQVALSHVLFKVLGSLLWLAIIPQLGHLVALITPHDLARQVANAHTVFNMVNAMLFIGFTKPFARLVMWILPDRKEDNTARIIPLLDNYYLSHVGLSLQMVHEALLKMGTRTLEIANDAFQIAIMGSQEELKQLRARDREIDRGQTDILQFLQKLEQQELRPEEANTLRSQIEATNILESVADLITTDLVEAAEHRIEKGFHISQSTLELLTDIYFRAIKVLGDTLEIARNEQKDENQIATEKEQFKQQLIEVRDHLVRRLSEDEPDRIAIYRFESELLEVTRRIHSLARRLYRKIF